MHKKEFGITKSELSAIFEKKNVERSGEDIATLMYVDINKGRVIEDFLPGVSDIERTKEHELLRLSNFGLNNIEVKYKNTFVNILKKNANDKMLFFLIGSAILSFLIGIFKKLFYGENYAWIEGFSILIVISLIIITGSANEYSQEILFRKLDRKKNDRLVKVYQNERMETKHIADVLVGDIVCMSSGDMVPADCMVISPSPLILDESLITGESMGVHKNAQDPFLTSGSYVVNGNCRALVIAVGENSFKGKLLKNLDEERTRTPLELKIEELSQSLAKKSIIVSIMIFAGFMLKLTFSRGLNLENIIEALIEAISIAVMAIPEGLPIAMTLALSFGTKRMLSDNSLVRDMKACEVMNNANYLCTDKTGTLTHNILQIKRTFFNGEKQEISTIHNQLRTKTPMEFTELMILNSTINSTSFIDRSGRNIGSKVETALIKYLKEDGVDYTKLRIQYPYLKRKNFESEGKYMSTTIARGEKYTVLYKGASEKILEACEFEDLNGEIRKIEKNKILKFIEESNRNCLRTICMCYEEVDEINETTGELDQVTISEKTKKVEELERARKMIFLAAISFEDPLRENIYEQIDLFKRAGINIIMLTGDNKEMASYLGEKTGILSSSYTCISGEELKLKSDDEILSEIHNIRVIARAKPEDKRRFVELLQRQGNVVAVTGDGSNDGPALKRADVGFAMGDGGSDIAHEAASVVILNDDFFSLVKTVSWGRCINDSIRKFIQFQLSVTFSVIGTIILGTILYSRGILFTPLMILWINIYMDSFSALSLSTGSPTYSLLLRSPEKRDSPVITSYMKLFIGSTTVFQLILMTILIGMDLNKTFIFNTFFFLQIFNQANARGISSSTPLLTSFTQNKIYIAVNILSILLQILVVEKLNLIFGTEPLSLNLWMISIALAALILPYFEGIRILQRRKINNEVQEWKKMYNDLSTELRVVESFKKLSKIGHEK